MSDLDFLLSSYNFNLPDELIATFPPEKRGDSRLLYLAKDCIAHKMFSDLPQCLPENALLVANNSKVLPARIYGQRQSGGKVECLLLTPLPLVKPCPCQGANNYFEAEAEVLLRPSNRLKVAEELIFPESLRIIILEIAKFGRCKVKLRWSNSLENIFVKYGHLPLPPYLKRSEQALDQERYQTIYARDDKRGSAAAPTAGLHFEQKLRRELTQSGFTWAEVTLHVGYGTFSPIRCSDIREHSMHAEYAEIDAHNLNLIAKAKKEQRPIIAIGTTATRTLETFASELMHLMANLEHNSINDNSLAKWTDIFIYPGYKFQIIDGLITNFHLPESSLLVLIAALVGREKILNVYQEAISEKYRFFSYGDAMLILP